MSGLPTVSLPCVTTPFGHTHRETPRILCLAYLQVVVYSKTTCPFCERTKSLFETLEGVSVKTIELDLLDEGGALQLALLEKTGQRTVPNVFVGGVHLGGNDATQANSERIFAQ